MSKLTELERAVVEAAGHLIDIEEGGDIEEDGATDGSIDAYAKLLEAVTAWRVARAAQGRIG